MSDSGSRSRPWSTHRYYDTAHGRRRNIVAAAEMLRITPVCFWNRQKNGWARLNGGRLSSVPMRINHPIKKDATEDTYLEADLEALMVPEQMAAGYRETPDGIRLTRRAAAQLLKVSPAMVRYFERRGLLCAAAYGRHTTYAQSDVEALRQRLAERKAAPAPNRHANPDPSRDSQRAGRFSLSDGAYLSLRAAKRVLGLNPQTVYWLDRTGRVQTALKPGDVHGAKIYSEADLKEYLRSRDVPFDGVYDNGRINLACAAKLCGRSRGEIGLWIRRRWLHSEKQAPPPMRGRTVREHTVDRRELRDLVARLDATLRQGRPADNWKMIDELVKLLKFKGGYRMNARAELLRRLAPYVASGAIKTHRPELPTERLGTATRRCLYYDLDDVRRFLVNPSRQRNNPGPKPNSAVQRVYHVCASVYAGGTGLTKRIAQLADVQQRLGKSGPQRVPNVATMRTYSKRHNPTKCPVCAVTKTL